MYLKIKWDNKQSHILVLLMIVFLCLILRIKQNLYMLITQKTCKPLYEIIIRELAALILHPVACNLFFIFHRCCITF